MMAIFPSANYSFSNTQYFLTKYSLLEIYTGLGKGNRGDVLLRAALINLIMPVQTALVMHPRSNCIEFGKLRKHF